MEVNNDANPTPSETASSSQRELIFVVLALAAASIFYRVAQSSDFKNTSILFIGLPTVIAILVIKSGTPKSTQGLIFKVITLFLLISSIILHEGMLCIIIAAPIFYLVGFLIGLVTDYFSDDNKIGVIAVLPILLLAAQPWKLKDPQVYEVSTSVNYTHPVSIEDLTKEPDFLAHLPTVFRYGFPKPISIEGGGLEPKDRRNIEFVSTTKGAGYLVLEVAETTDQQIVFLPVRDDTHIGSWLTWQRITVSIAGDDEMQVVTWTSEYTCNLGPQWYFQPLEELAIDRMHRFLIHSYFE